MLAFFHRGAGGAPWNSLPPRVFHRRLTSGGFLTIGYCLSYCFLEIFVGGQGSDGGEQSRDVLVPSLRNTLPPWNLVQKQWEDLHNYRLCPLWKNSWKKASLVAKICAMQAGGLSLIKRFFGYAPSRYF